MKKTATPQELKELQQKTGLSKAELAARLGMTAAAWDNLISVNSQRNLPVIKYEFLLLLAGEHPDYVLQKRDGLSA